MANSAFRSVENPHFKKMITNLRPGYEPPTRKALSDDLLPEIYEEEFDKLSRDLKGKVVCLGTDGWSNVHNQPIVCTTVTTDDGAVHLIDTVDTSGNPHTAEYLTDVVREAIQKTESQFGCTIGSVVTDNAKNVAKMRESLKEESGVIGYGCSAHLFHLLAKDLDVPQVSEHVVFVVKYFRNNHFACAKYREEGGKALMMPQEVRWNTMINCLDGFITAWSTLVKICESEDGRAQVD